MGPEEKKVKEPNADSTVESSKKCYAGMVRLYTYIWPITNSFYSNKEKKKNHSDFRNTEKYVTTCLSVDAFSGLHLIISVLSRLEKNGNFSLNQTS